MSHNIPDRVTVTKHAGSKHSLVEHQTVGVYPYKGQWVPWNGKERDISGIIPMSWEGYRQVFWSHKFYPCPMTAHKSSRKMLHIGSYNKVQYSTVQYSTVHTVQIQLWLTVGLITCSAVGANQPAQGTSDIKDSVKTQPVTVTFRNANCRIIM